MIRKHSFLWIFDVSKRFASVDSKGRSAVTSFLATIGISFGVMALIAVISVMNGFQMSFIDSIMELSSYHIRVECSDEAETVEFLNFCEDNQDGVKYIRSVSPFMEAQGLIVGKSAKEQTAIVRAVKSDVLQSDSGFNKELKIISGSFDLSDEKSIVLGKSLASSLGVRVGNEINIFALSTSSDMSFLSSNRTFVVKGIFECGYIDINSSYSFISLESGKSNFGKSASVIYGVKIENPNREHGILSILKKNFKNAKITSWREYNRSFFGTLRIEKNILMLLVFIIFIVVAINIYNGMRRLVFERASEISILSALGGTNAEIKMVFILRGFLTGFIGAFFGVIFGIVISKNMNFIFMAISKIMYLFEYVRTFIFSRGDEVFVQENQMYALYASIPPRIFLNEVVFIAFFGIFSPLAASYLASKNVLKMKISEVLRDE